MDNKPLTPTNNLMGTLMNTFTETNNTILKKLQAKLVELENSRPRPMDGKYRVLDEEARFHAYELDYGKHTYNEGCVRIAIDKLETSKAVARAMDLIN
jgi:hypothetical protein